MRRRLLHGVKSESCGWSCADDFLWIACMGEGSQSPLQHRSQAKFVEIPTKLDVENSDGKIKDL